MTKLFKITLKAENNRNLSERVEYVKAKSKEFLQKSMISACNAPHSEYYGYRFVEIQDAKDVPQIIGMKVKLPKRKKK